MTRFTHRAAGLALLALAALPLASLASAAQAEERIHVGDLSQPAQLAAFNRGVARATANLCGADLNDLSMRNAYLYCAATVREEALSQLSPAHREQLAAATASEITVASAAR